MKKMLALILAALLLAAFVSCSKKEPEEEIDDTPAVGVQPEETEDETEPSSPGEAPTSVAVTEQITLTVEKDPVYENDTLVLYFTDHELYYPDDLECVIGMISAYAADSVKATPDMVSYPDMFDGDNYRGIALKPAEPLPSGTYTFDMTIQ